MRVWSSEISVSIEDVECWFDDDGLIVELEVEQIGDVESEDNELFSFGNLFCMEVEKDSNFDNKGETMLELKMDVGGFIGNVCVDKFFFTIELSILLPNPHRQLLWVEPQFFLEPPFLSCKVASSLWPCFLFLQSADLWLQRPCVRQ